MEAAKLCANTDLIVQVATGGNAKTAMLRKTQREGVHLLVATPGRLNDLLTDPYSKIAAPNLTTLVLDEADRLLDTGFAGDIEEIIKLLPDRRQMDRQTMLFSATIPPEVQRLARSILKPDFHFVQTVQEGDVATHEKVPQKIVEVLGYENFMPTVLELTKREIESANTHGTKPFKAMVFFNSTANVILANEIFQNLKGESGGMFGKHPLYPAEMLVIHGQLHQSQRTRASDRFRRAKSAILFSTDVTARGLDFPDVTHVIQINPPPNREQYIHRIGRTGRGDKTGEGYILVTKMEMSSARRLLRGLPITADTSLEAAKVDMTAEAHLPASLATTLMQIGDSTKMVGRELKDAAYLAALSQMGKGEAAALVPALNQWTRYGWGWDQPPSISRGLAQKIGLNGIPGLNIRSSPVRESYSGDRSPRDDRGSFGGDRAGRGSFGNRPSYGDRSNRGFGGDRGGQSRYGNDRGRGGSGGGRGGFGGDRGGRDRNQYSNRGREEATF